MSAARPPAGAAEGLCAFLQELQAEIAAALEAEDGAARFDRPVHETPGGGSARPFVLEGGEVLERAAVLFTNAKGDALPEAATQGRPELAGQAFEAVSMSLITHPRNPHAPTSHANFRAFLVGPEAARVDAWFGGGFDLTPCYGYDEDCRHWHRTARAAFTDAEQALYTRMKQDCDTYFFLPHRGEARGIGGLFFDDFRGADFASGCDLWMRIAGQYLPAYRPILARRKLTPFTPAERDWQLIRRGRYVEFNLLHDRGTKHGLQSGRNPQSVLCSLPPEVRWRRDEQPAPGSREAALLDTYLVPRDWAGD